MINKKKIVQRLNKGSKLKEYPLLNLYILVAAFFQFIGEIFSSSFLKLLRPAPLLLMIIYIHSKNSTRKHLVPTLVEVALFLFLLVDSVAAFGDDSPNAISTGVKLVAHIVYCISLGFGDSIRLLLNMRMLRKLAYLAIIGGTLGIIYVLFQILPNRIISSIYLAMLSVQLWMSLWRYQITLRSSFMFSLCGSGLLVVAGWMSLWASGIVIGLVQLLTYCGHYFLMHGSLHQSNLQFQIDKLQDSFRRNY